MENPIKVDDLGVLLFQETENVWSLAARGTLKLQSVSHVNDSLE